MQANPVQLSANPTHKIILAISESLSQGNWQAALNVWKNEYAKWPFRSSQGRELSLLGVQLYLQTNQPQEALEVLSNALLSAMEAEDIFFTCKAHFFLYQTHRLKGEVLRALQHIEQAEMIAESLSLTTERIAFLNEKGDLLLQIGNRPLAQESFERAIQLAKQASDLDAELGSFGNLARLLWNGNEEDWNTALGFFQRIEEAADKAGWAKRAQEAKTNRLALLVRLGRYDEAHALLGEMENEAERAEEPQQERIDLQIRRAALYGREGRHKEARLLYETLSHHSLPPLQRAELLSNYGVALKFLGESKKAMESFEESQYLAETHQAREIEAVAVAHIAALLLESRSPQTQKMLKKARNLAESLGSTEVLRYVASLESEHTQHARPEIL